MAKTFRMAVAYAKLQAGHKTIEERCGLVYNMLISLGH